jgi:Rad3-related DNA helicase
VQYRSVEQANFAGLIEQHIQRCDAPLLIEGTTGLGKTRAYLSPLIASGKRVVIALPTHALIDQLLASSDLAATRSQTAVEAFRPAAHYDSRPTYLEARDRALAAQVMLCTSASVIIDQRLRGEYNGSTARDYILFDEADQLPSAAALQQDTEIDAITLRDNGVTAQMDPATAARTLLTKRLEPEIRAAAAIILEVCKEPAWYRTVGRTETGALALFHRLPGRLLKRIANNGNVAFVSATLAVNGNFNDFKSAMGIANSSALSTTIEPARHGAVRFHVYDNHAVGSDAWLDATKALLVDVPRPALVITPSFELAEQLQMPDATIRGRDETTAQAAARMTGGLLIAAGAWAGLDTSVVWRSIVVPRIPFPKPTVLDEHVESSYIGLRSEAWRRMRQALGRGLRSQDADIDFYLLDARHATIKGFMPKRFTEAWQQRMVEGARRELVISAVERSPYYRKAALAKYGCYCHACNFRPRVESQIHVHHLRPLHEGERDTTIEDLIPLCANCHALAHSEDPPIQLEALKVMMVAAAES